MFTIATLDLFTQLKNQKVDLVSIDVLSELFLSTNKKSGHLLTYLKLLSNLNYTPSLS